MGFVVKLTKHHGQYRITLPRELLAKCEMEDVEFVSLEWFPLNTIIIEEYHGAKKEKRDLPEDQS